MKILAFDTSTKAGSVCLLENETIIGELYFNLDKTHSERILPIIDYLLNFANIDIKEIDLFVSGIGPGSFTGIRIGLSIAKGFSFALKKPLIGISSLDALAFNYYFEDEYLSIIEGRNKEYFYAIYKWENLNFKRISEYNVCKFENLPMKKIAVILEDSLFISKNEHSEFKIDKVFNGNLFAHNYGILGYKKFLTNNKITADINPLYLKPSDAEIKFHPQS